MVLTDEKTNFFSGLVALYHLLINADGHVNEKELRMGRVMKKHEKINDWEFNYHLRKVAGLTNNQIINICIESLKKCDYNDQVKAIAWMSLIANSDGFMAPEEWKLIYRIYNNELHLKLSDILETQKVLPKE